MSSGHDSTGDLIPADMLEVFAQDRQGKRSKRSRRRGSFSRAFTWFKSRRRKTLRTSTDPKIDLLKPGPVPLLTPIKDHKEETENPLPVQHILENVFIEGNRPTFVQDLYSEAQEGLKLLQQDENKNGVDFLDNQSVTSTVTARTDDDVSFSELAMSESESTADTISTRSSISYQSSRSGLTRQGSTFRPLKEDQRHSKRKAKKRHMGNVPGIPRHVQKELGLDRAAWTASQFTQAQLSNGGLSISTVVPTLDSISIASDGEVMHLHAMNSSQEANESRAHVPSAGHRDDLNLLQHFLSHSLDPHRPGSLAVPWMTTAGHCPPSPVMYVSPEATYKSKIIPDAILIPSVDVVELKRNRTRSSVRMVSQSSLASASPAPSRPSSRASSRISSRASSRFSSRAPSRASNQTGPNSEYSGWSNSGSSETLVSDSSTISNSSSPRVASRASQQQITDGPVRGNGRYPHVYGKTAQLNGHNKEEETWKKAGMPGQFRRNLSVTKKSKNPPPPPSRSYSLHAQRSKSNAKPKTENPIHLAETCSSGNKSDTTDDGSVKLVSPYSQNINVLCKSNLVNPHSSERQRWIKLKDSLPYFKKLAANGVVPSQTVLTLMTILDVPDPPHVLAPPPPPPEAWVHNQHTFELLCGPGPVNLMQWAHKRGMKLDWTQVIDSGSTTMQSTKLNGEVASFDTETSKNKLNHNILESIKKIVIQPNQGTALDSKAPSSKMAMDVQLTNGNTMSLPDSGPLHLSSTPSPPAEHPLPTQKAQFRSPLNEFLFLPPHPVYPPPPPPQKSLFTCSSSGLDETDTSFSENKIPPPPQIIPPPPPMVPPSPPLVIPPQTSQIHQKTHPAPHVIPTPPQPPPPQLIPPPPQQIVPPPPQTPPPSIPPLQYEIPPPPQLIPPPPQFTSSAPEVMPIPPTDPIQAIASNSINFDIRLIPQMIPPPPNVLHVLSENLPSTHVASSLEKETPSSTKEHKPTLIKNPSPQKTASTTAEEVSFATQEVSSVPSGISLPFNVPPPPPPPPLPTDIKSEVKAVLTETPDKKQSPETTHSATTKEESPPPMVTPSLLQTVRLRSVKSTVNRVETSPDGLPKRSTQDPPPKPVRRSLILVATDLASQFAGDLVDNEQLQTNLEVHPVAQVKKESGSSLQEHPNLHLEPAALPKPAQSISHINDADKKTQNAASDSLKQSAHAESITVVLNKVDPTPKMTLQGSPKTPPKKIASETSTESNGQPESDATPESGHHEIPTKIKEKPNNTLLPSVLVPQTVTSKLPPTQNVSPASTSSMRLQEAIRLKTAAMNSKDQSKRLSLHSPPPSAGGISPTSTANFIFSKSTKKVVIETTVSTKTNLQKNLLSELSSLPYKSKPIESKNLKVPPPVAKKPSAKNENTADAEDVQTAGQ